MILDTNAISAIADGDAAIKPVLFSAAVVQVPVIALGEYLFGVAQSLRRADYERWMRNWAFQILSVDATTAQEYAEIRLELKRAGKPIPVNDLWIAALARQYNLPVLSRDQHFDSIAGLRRFGW